MSWNDRFFRKPRATPPIRLDRAVELAAIEGAPRFVAEPDKRSGDPENVTRPKGTPMSWLNAGALRVSKKKPIR